MAPREERRRTLVSLGRQFSLQGLSWLAESSDPNPSPDILPRSLPGAPPTPHPAELLCGPGRRSQLLLSQGRITQSRWGGRWWSSGTSN